MIDLSRQPESIPGIEILLDTLADLTRKLFNCPVAHLSAALGKSGGRYETVMGPHVGAVPAEGTLCEDALKENRIVVVENLRKDPTFRNHPMVVPKGPGISFFIGVPIVLSSGEQVGTLCAMDFVEHKYPSKQSLAMFRHLATSVAAAIERHASDPVEAATPKPRQGKSLTDEIRSELDQNAAKGNVEALNGIATSLIEVGNHARDLLERHGSVTTPGEEKSFLEENTFPVENVFGCALTRNWQTSSEARRARMGDIQRDGFLFVDGRKVSETIVTLLDVLKEQKAIDPVLELRIAEGGEVQLNARGRLNQASALMSNALRGQAVANPAYGVLTNVDLTAAREVADAHAGVISIVIKNGIIHATLSLPGWRLVEP